MARRPALRVMATAEEKAAAQCGRAASEPGRRQRGCAIAIWVAANRSDSERKGLGHDGQLTGVVECLKSGRRPELALPQFVAHHPHFEQQRGGIDATPDLIEIRRMRVRRPVDDVEEGAFEFVEHVATDDSSASTASCRKRRFAAMRSRAHCCSADNVRGRRVHDVGEHPIGPLEMIGDVRSSTRRPSCGSLSRQPRRACWRHSRRGVEVVDRRPADEGGCDERHRCRGSQRPADACGTDKVRATKSAMWRGSREDPLKNRTSAGLS